MNKNVKFKGISKKTPLLDIVAIITLILLIKMLIL